MKLLPDENLSRRLVPRLSGRILGSTHGNLIGLHGASDAAIWNVARERGCTIVSKDVDFYQRSVAFGPPPKVIWLRIGNGPTSVAELAIREHLDLIGQFAADPEAGFLVLPA